MGGINVKSVFIIALAFLTNSGFALGVDNFKGQWKETAWRCEGSSTINPRGTEFGDDKFLTIGDSSTYFHRVEMQNYACPTVESSGTLTGTPNGVMTAITVSPQLSVGCPIGSGADLLDDFATQSLIKPFNMYLDNVGGTTYLVLNGDTTYASPSCGGTQMIERLYQNLNK
jgi:hypothetical protein